jgi:sugar lactone lactonase YvrE
MKRSLISTAAAIGAAVLGLAGLATLCAPRMKAADEGGNQGYQAVVNWAEIPGTGKWDTMTGVDVDAQGNVYAFQRTGPAEIMVFTAQGKYVKTWGADAFPNGHAVRVARDGSVWVTDKTLEQALKYDKDGKLLMALGTKGVDGKMTSENAFNGVADVAVGPNDDIFVADGEGGNARVVKFTKDGKFVKYWGTKGAGPGQFDTPHGIATDSKGHVWVCDRANKRLESFDADGNFLAETKQFGAASSIYITKDDILYVASQAPDNKVTIGTEDGKILGSIGGLYFAHGVAVDPTGAVYVAESQGKALLKWVKK